MAPVAEHYQKIISICKVHNVGPASALRARDRRTYKRAGRGTAVVHLKHGKEGLEGEDIQDRREGAALLYAIEGIKRAAVSAVSFT